MFRIIAALFLLLASVAAASAQGLFPSIWQSERGALLKVLAVDPATGNFTGVFVSGPAGSCQGVPYDLVGRVRGSRVVFQTSRNWTTDCRATTVWSGRFSRQSPLPLDGPDQQPSRATDQRDLPPSGIRSQGSDLRDSLFPSDLGGMQPEDVRCPQGTCFGETRSPVSRPAARAPRAAMRPHRRAA